MTHRAPLGAVLFFALLAVTVAIAVLVVRARTPDLMLEVTTIEPHDRVIAPVGGKGPPEAVIRFFVRESDPAAEVAIVDSREGIVRVLDADAQLEADEEVTYTWDGTTEPGTTAAPGRYRLQVVLPDHDRQMVWPRRITVLPPLPPREPPGDGSKS